ncbi:beta-1,4-galactosyltransferase galt-1-like [Liolophura sinensis]|uniref:beta-1,4-galactosyltransferase galt-1-like n=1 Tax=Liolophura sinensis TaxID=3198878 RepID=UPI0031586597
MNASGQKQRVNKTSTFVSILPGVLGYSAYMDTRYDPPRIRIISAVNDRAPKKGLCFFWPPSSLNELKAKFGERLSNLTEAQKHQRLSFFASFTFPKLTSPIEFHKTCEGHDLAYVAYYLSCVVPAQVRAPVSTVIISKSLMWSSLDQFVELQVTSIPRIRHTTDIQDQYLDQRTAVESLKLGVCVPPLFGAVERDSLMEFIEATMVLGANHFLFYDYEMSDDSRDLLRFYQNVGTVTVLPWGIPFPDASIWYHGQSVAIADCLFRTMGHFDWVTFNDIDEFIVPRGEITSSGTIPEFLVAYGKLNMSGFSTIASLGFQSAIFYTPTSLVTNIKSNTFKSMISVKRTKTVSKVLTKQIVRPERVFELGIHHLSSALHANFTGHLVSQNIGLLHHYKECKPEPRFLINCDEFVEDKAFYRYVERFKHRVKKTLSQLALLKLTGSS